jgi:hypothetical protein
MEGENLKLALKEVGKLIKVGEESWFEFAEDEEGKKIAVCIKITKE